MYEIILKVRKHFSVIPFKTILLGLYVLLYSIQTHAQVVTTFAGSGTAGGTDGTGTSASFNDPIGVTIDGSGNLYITDYTGNKIRKITPAGVVSTFAAGFYGPFGMAIDQNGNLYVADYLNHKICKITPAGLVSTFAGSGVQGSTDATGTAASFFRPRGIAIDGSGNLYVCDEYNYKIRKITPAGVVSTFAGSGNIGSADGTGTAASFYSPSGITIDGSGNLYVSDSYKNNIRKITSTGVVSTFAGSGTSGSTDGIGTAASFNGPSEMVFDGSGNLYVCDIYNHKIRKITPAGAVSTFVGSGSAGSTDGIGTAASFHFPSGITIDGTGTLYVADQANHKIRKITTCVSPTVNASFNNNVLCVGHSSTLTISGTATSYSLNSVATATTAIVSPTATSTYTITGESSGCTNTTIKTITVNALPTITASVTNSVICTGSSTMLNASGASTYIWTGGVINGIAFTPTVTSTYTVYGTNTITACTNMATKTITVNALPTISVSSTHSLLCTGQTATLNIGGTASSYSLNSVATTPTHTVSPTSTTTYTISGTHSNGCSNASTFSQSVSTCTDIDELANPILQFTFYPNPAKDRLMVNIFKNKIGNISLLDVLGKEVIQQNTKDVQTELNISNLQDGVYFVRVIQEGKTSIQKVIIHK